MATITSLLTATITATDAASNVPVNRTPSGLVFAGDYGEFQSYKNLPVAGTDYPLDIPTSPAQVVYIKNLTAAGGAGDITVKWTPLGGIEAIVALLRPQSAIFLVENSAGGGLSSIKLSPSAVNLKAEFYIGG